MLFSFDTKICSAKWRVFSFTEKPDLTLPERNEIRFAVGKYFINAFLKSL